MIRILIGYILLLPLLLSGQSASLDYDPLLMGQVERLSAIYPDSMSRFHTSIRYQESDFLLEKVERLSVVEAEFSSQLSERFSFFDVDTGRFSFYKNEHHAIRVNEPNFKLDVDPIFLFSIGEDRHDDATIFQNTRGIKIRGSIDDRVYFYSSIYENQRRFLSHAEDYIDRYRAIPGQGFYQRYDSRVFGGIEGRDYLNAQAYIGWRLTPSIGMQLGQGKHHIGNGIRSMLLSDLGHNYFYLKMDTRVWRFHYQNIFAQLAADGRAVTPGQRVIDQKYMTSHYLTAEITPRLHIGLFESIIFSRGNHFELSYLNPVILYRSVEQLLDSPDNALLGGNISYIPAKGIKIYGQLMIDELKLSQLLKGTGWWANKWAIQAGVNYFDALGISHLHLQAEYNQARPYTYTHRLINDEESSVIASYTHYNQPLAHPLGANFRELIMQADYSIDQRWFFDLRYVYARYGDSLDENVGFDIRQDYTERQMDFDNKTGQGVGTSVSLARARISWQWRPQYFVDLEYVYRDQSSASEALKNRSSYIGIALRANMWNQSIDY